MMPYFVKFVPYNENTLSALINKTIKFSTVYEFNDFNELAYCGTDCNGFESRFWDIFYKKFENSIFRELFLKNINMASHYKTEYLNDFKNRFYNHTRVNPTLCIKKDYPFIIENMVFSSVGVFCVSDLDVFCDDSAQLMFAHYSDNLRGLALIYEIPSTVSTKIEYRDGLRISGGVVDRTLKWLDGDYSDMHDFINKTQKWEYEKEYRIFCNPQIANATKHEITLKAILFTLRFSENNVDTLKAINKDIYKNHLIIQEIRPSYSDYKFVISGSEFDGYCVSRWLLNTLESPPQIKLLDRLPKLIRPSYYNDKFRKRKYPLYKDYRNRFT